MWHQDQQERESVCERERARARAREREREREREKERERERERERPAAKVRELMGMPDPTMGVVVGVVVCGGALHAHVPPGCRGHRAAPHVRPCILQGLGFRGRWAEGFRVQGSP